jgi:tetratricopeptide (TPR) repeat protein
MISNSRYAIVVATVVVIVLVACLFSFNKPNLTGNSVAVVKKNVSSSEPRYGDFYDYYDKAKAYIASGDYENAVGFLTESVKHAQIIVERDMALGKLAEVYRFQNKPDLELKYLNLILDSIPANAPPSRKRDEMIQRAEYLKSRLAPN